MWDISGALGLSNAEFHEPIEKASSRFWEDIKPLPWFIELMDLVESLTDDWHIISDPSFCSTAYYGKVLWLRRNFGPDFTRFCLTPHKEIFARHGAILIDDREENINKFVEAGGIGIVFPSLGNSLHELRSNPVLYVQQKLEEIFQCT